MYNVRDLVGLFTDHFRKDPESNTYKLMRLFSGELQTLKATNDRILEWRDIDAAEGKTLDLIGQNINQPRGRANDARYRIMLKTKIARNLSDGTINGLIKSISYVLQVDKSLIQIGELWRVLNEPAAIAVEEIPLDKISNAGLTSDEFETILQSFVSAGVRLMLMSSGSNQYLEMSGNPYGFEVYYKITSRFRAGRVHGSIAQVSLELGGAPYEFEVVYPITSRFRTAPVPGALERTDLVLAGAPYTFEAEHPITGRFGTAPVPGVVATTDLEMEGLPYGFNVKYPITGNFKTAAKAGAITSAELPGHETYTFEVPQRITGRFRAGGRKQ